MGAIEQIDPIRGGRTVRVRLLLMGAALLWASSTPASALQCVPYAREVSGIDLYGNAWQWWNAASGRYEKGRVPSEGAVMVFPSQGSMRHGHLAVVSKIVSNRLILVDHANWAPIGGEGRGQIAKAVPVLDLSTRNDWSQVKVWYRPIDDYGTTVYRTKGFVYASSVADNRAGRPVIPDHRLSEASMEGLVTVARHAFAGRVAPSPPQIATSDSGKHKDRVFN